MLDLLFSGRRLVFESALSLEEVTQRLQREVAPPKWQLIETRPHLFEGTFSDGRFSMARKVGGRNSFRPMIEGQLSRGPRGARVDVQLKLHPAIVIFCAVLFSIGALVVAGIAASGFSMADVTPQHLPPMVVVPVVFIAFLFAPGVEARKATRLLAALFEAEPSRSRISNATT